MIRHDEETNWGCPHNWSQITKAFCHRCKLYSAGNSNQASYELRVTKSSSSSYAWGMSLCAWESFCKIKSR